MWAGARFEPALLERVAAPMAKWVAGFARDIHEAQAAGEVAAAIDPEDSATRIIALIEGLRPRWLQGELSTTEARRLMAEGIRRELLQPPGQSPPLPSGRSREDSFGDGSGHGGRFGILAGD